MALLLSCGGRVDLTQGGDVGPAPSSTVPGPEVTTTTLSGSFKGKTIQVHDAVAIVTEKPGETTMVIAYTDGNGLCSKLQANEQQSSTRYLSVIFIADSATGGGAPPVISPGSYSVSAPQAGASLFVSGGYSSLDGACQNNEVNNVAVSGNVVLATVTPRVSGSFELTFPAGDTFQGTFDVPSCPVTVTDLSPAACLP